MFQLFTQEQLQTSRSNDLLPLKCQQCSKTFLISKKYITQVLNGKSSRGYKLHFCSSKCSQLSRTTSEIFSCTFCDNPLKMKLSQKQRSKSGNIFCSKSCAAKYNNTHKTKGSRRSKLEIWLEQQLLSSYQQLKIQFNCKETINSELDIYIPSLKLAFELNGIFHYEPIYGSEKLASIQNNDNRKFQACLEQDIELVIIDTSSQKYFKEKTSQKYLKIIKDIIDNKLNYWSSPRDSNSAPLPYQSSVLTK